jgi:hypothetical protein
MSKLGLVVVMVLMLGRTNAQDYPAPTSDPPTYFVLIQADDGPSFYVRLDNQLYSSSPAGHLILARLKDSVYTLTVGFPGQLFPEQRYLLNIRQKDWALHLIRHDNGWGLMDDQGQAIPTTADLATAQKPLLAGAKKEDAFSQMMAAIVRDTAVMYNTYAAASDSAQTSAAADTPTMTVIVRDSAIRSDSVAPATAAKPGSLADTARSQPVPLTPQTTVSSSNPSSYTVSPVIPSSPTGVVKLSEHKSTQSLSLVYADHPADKKTDTIDVVIPVDSGTEADHPLRPFQPSSDTARTTARLQSADTARTTTRIPSADTVRTATRSQSADTAHSVTYITRLDSNSYIVHTNDYIHAVRVRKPSPDTPRSGPPGPPGPPVQGHAPKSDTPIQAGAPRKPSLPFINSDCHAFATDYDLDKLRVRMLNAGKDDDRIQVAYKIFKTKCFSTKQVGALSEVFTTDAAKFKFLGTAYPFVSDDHFPDLVGVFSDPVYAGKFRTMTGRH